MKQVPSNRDPQRALVSEISETRNFCLAWKQQHNLLPSHAHCTCFPGEVIPRELPGGQQLTFKTTGCLQLQADLHPTWFFFSIQVLSLSLQINDQYGVLHKIRLTFLGIQHRCKERRIGLFKEACFHLVWLCIYTYIYMYTHSSIYMCILSNSTNAK